MKDGPDRNYEVEDLGTATEQLVPAEEPDTGVPSEAEEPPPQ